MRAIERFERFANVLVLDNGQRMTLEPFQREMLEPFFSDTRETLALLPKGSGKTTLLGAVALYELISDPDADGAVCAASRDQAALLLRQIAGFVRRTPALQSRVRLRVREAVNRTGGRFRVIAADTDTADGLLLSFAIADELHRWRGSELYSILLAGCQKRDGRLFGISTAGVRADGLLWTMRQRAVEMGARRDGPRVSLRTPRFSWLEYSLSEDGDPNDLDAVKAANPGSWVTTELLRERKESPSMTPQDWARFSCNQWIEADALDAVIPPRQWAALGEPDAERPEWVVLGLDVSPKGSGAAIVAVGERDGLLYGAVLEAGEGSAWIVPALEQLVARYGNNLIVDERRVAHLMPELERVTDFHVRALRTQDVVTACEFFLRIVMEGKFRHRGEPELSTAVMGAAQRSISDGWGWSRKTSKVDISPLCAMTWAVDFYRGSWGTQTDTTTGGADARPVTAASDDSR